MKTQTVKIDKKKFFLNILLPTFLTIGLFIVLIFVFIIPYFELNLVEGKREMIREIVNSSFCIAAKFDEEALDGKISADEAKEHTIRTIEKIRYGTENKDYLWITDKHPVMIMHPYRKDLNGKNLSDFKDPLGKKLFVEIVKKIKSDSAGYVDYMWQWMDDPRRIVPKISYVKEYPRWGWIIGTGIYIEDVRKEISGIKKILVFVSLCISIMMALMLTIIVRRNLRVEHQRCIAEAQLKESREKYKALVEAYTDGTLMFVDKKCIYSNQKMNDLLVDLDTSKLSEDLHEIIHTEKHDDVLIIKEFIEGELNSLQLESVISCKNNTNFQALVTISKVSLSEKKGLIVIIKDLEIVKIGSESDNNFDPLLKKISEIKDIGIFSAEPRRKGKFKQVNNALVEILGFSSKENLLKTSVLDLIDNDNERKEFFNYLSKHYNLSGYPLRIINNKCEPTSLLIFAFAGLNDNNIIENISGIILNVTSFVNQNSDKNDLLEKLLSVRNIFSSHVKNFIQEPEYCAENTSLQKAIELMNFYNTDTLLVKSTSGNVVGFISEKEITTGILQNTMNINIPVHSVMNSQLLNCNESFTLSEAIYKMQSNHSYHLITRQNDMKIVGILNAKKLFSLLLAFNMSFDKIDQIKSMDQLISLQGNIHTYVKYLLTSGATVHTISHIVTNYSDKITLKLIDMVINEMGEPPAKFVFIALGSEGRKEQTLLTDQDNAIIFDDEATGNEIVKQYFLKFGKRINELLHKAGYNLCKGEIMAGNLKWNQPLNVWKKYFTEWITNAQPQNILEISIFFDYRTIYGDACLTDELRSSINALLVHHPPFYAQMAMNCLNFKIPINLFGRLQTGPADDSSGTINIKNASRLIVYMIRLYAMKNKVEETNTLKRLEFLSDSKVFTQSLYLDLSYSFNFLLLTQFRYQTYAITKNIHLDNNMSLSFLSSIEVNTLKTIFSNISVLMNNLKHDFGI